MKKSKVFFVVVIALAVGIGAGAAITDSMPRETTLIIKKEPPKVIFA